MDSSHAQTPQATLPPLTSNFAVSRLTSRSAHAATAPWDVPESLLRLQLAHRPHRRRHHRHRRTRRRMGAIRHGPLTSNPSTNPSPQITDVSVDGTKNSSQPEHWFQQRSPTLKSHSISRSPEPPTTPPPARPPPSACTGRRTSPPPCKKPLKMDAMCAPSPGAPTKPPGARPPPIKWNRWRRPPPPAAWSSLRPQATTTPAMAASTPANVDVPSSCPHVVGCGGTYKTKTGETVWNDNPGQTNGEGTGGGYSTIFPVQSFQIGTPPAPSGTTYGKGRMVPDVAADADPNTGYQLYRPWIHHRRRRHQRRRSALRWTVRSFGKKLGFVTPTL